MIERECSGDCFGDEVNGKILRRNTSEVHAHFDLSRGVLFSCSHHQPQKIFVF
jgi:hypothetical protein